MSTEQSIRPELETLDFDQIILIQCFLQDYAQLKFILLTSQILLNIDYVMTDLKTAYILPIAYAHSEIV